MVQQTFTDMEYANRKRTTRREAFPEAMESIIPWNEWMALIAAVLCPERARQKTDPPRNHAAYVPYAEPVRSFR